MNVKDLTPEERAKLMKELAEQQSAEKEQKKANKKAYKSLSQDFVNKNIALLIMHQQATEKIITDLFEEYKTIAELKQEAYGIREQDSHTNTLADGSASITIGRNVTIKFDGTESAGVEKIKDFITSLAGDNDNEQKLIKMVNTFLKPNAKTGMLNPAKIIELSKLREEFNDERFNEGLDDIFNAQIRSQNSMYVCGYQYQDVDGKPKKINFRFTV